MDKVLTPTEASEIFFQGKISKRTILKMFHDGIIKGTQIGKKILIFEHSLEEVVRANQNEKAIAEPLLPLQSPQEPKRQKVPLIRLRPSRREN